MKTASINRAILNELTMIMAVFAILVLAATEHAPAQAAGWAVGDKGTIFKYDNTKDQWFSQGFAAVYNLNGVDAVDRSHVWAVGDVNPGSGQATIVFSPDGTNWYSAVNVPSANKLNSVSFANVNTGWAVGNAGTILAYAGGNWAAQQAPAGTPSLNGVAAKGSTVCAVGDSTTIIFYDGVKWNPASTIPPGGGTLRSIVLVDTITGFAVGDVVGPAVRGALIWRTDDSCKTWRVVTPGNLTLGSGPWRAVQARAIVGSREYEIWIAGKDCWARGVTGGTWYLGNNLNTKFDSTPGGDTTGLAFINGSTGWAVFRRSDGTGGIVRSSVPGQYYRWAFDKTDKKPLALNAIVMLPKLNPGVKLDQFTEPNSGMGGLNHLSISAAAFPNGNIDPFNVTVQLAMGCHETVSAATTGVSVVSSSGEGRLVSFLLPDGLAPGKYFVSISDSAEGDANFESSNCSEVSVSQ